MGFWDRLFGGFSSGPAVNVDGSPMVGDSGVDIHGNPFGVSSSDSSFSSSSDSGWSSGGSDFGGGFGGGMGGF